MILHIFVMCHTHTIYVIYTRIKLCRSIFGLWQEHPCCLATTCVPDVNIWLRRDLICRGRFSWDPSRSAINRRSVASVSTQWTFRRCKAGFVQENMFLRLKELTIPWCSCCSYMFLIVLCVFVTVCCQLRRFTSTWIMVRMSQWENVLHNPHGQSVTSGAQFRLVCARRCWETQLVSVGGGDINCHPFRVVTVVRLRRQTFLCWSLGLPLPHLRHSFWCLGWLSAQFQEVKVCS